MATCPSFFPAASDARINPKAERAVHDEVCQIQSAVLTAIRLGYFEATIDNGSPMTTSSSRPLEVWSIDPLTDTLYVPNHGFSATDTVTVLSTVTLPAPLRSDAYYYVIYIDKDHIKLTDTYAASNSGRPIAIDITAGVTNIGITNEGSGYLYPPAVTLSGGSPTQVATATAHLASWGGVVGVSVSSPGAGYDDAPTVQFVPQGLGASYDQIIYKVVGITVANAGVDYRVGDIISVVGGTGTAATATVNGVNANGSITSVSPNNPGAYSVLPLLTGASTTVMPGGGVGATVNLSMGISGVTILSGGSGYIAPPRVVITDPSGQSAVATAAVTGGSVTSVTVQNPGYGYLGAAVTFDSGENASAIASLIPAGVLNVSVIDDGGATYTSVPNVTISPVGSGATIASVAMRVVSCQLTSPGSGYQKDDILLISGGVATENAYIRVTSVDSAGRIQTFSLESGGNYTLLPGLISNPVNGGAGILAAFNLMMGVATVSVGSAGSNYAVPPLINIAPPVSGTPATALANITTGQLATIDVRSPGSGYTSIPVVTISNGSGATAQANLTPTPLGDIQVTNGGSSYTLATVEITGGGASVPATAVANIVGDVVDSITIIDPGEGYTSVPTITITGDGNGAVANAFLSPTSVASIDVLNAGAGYNYPPAVTITGDATAISRVQATGIDRIIMTSQGTSYTSDPYVFLIPGPYQAGIPSSPVLVVQRGFSVASITISSSGVSYQSAPSVQISPPQIVDGTQATAVASIGVGLGTFAIRAYPASQDYFKAWKNMPLSNELFTKPYQDRMATVIAYFQAMGYVINRLTNPTTNTTLMWKVQW